MTKVSMLPYSEQLATEGCRYEQSPQNFQAYFGNRQTEPRLTITKV